MQEEKNYQIGLKNYLWLATLYFIAVGLLYLWGYWWSFGINIFEFANLSDIVMIAIIPVGSAFTFVLIGILIGEFGYAKYLPEYIGKDTTIGYISNKIKLFLIIMYWGSVIFLILSTNLKKWMILPFWASFGPYILLKNSSFLSTIKDDSKRSLIVFVLIVLPIYSFSQGKISANIIIKNIKYFYIKSNNKVMKYIGHVGEKYFFYLRITQKY